MAAGHAAKGKTLRTASNGPRGGAKESPKFPWPVSSSSFELGFHPAARQVFLTLLWLSGGGWLLPHLSVYGSKVFESLGKVTINFKWETKLQGDRNRWGPIPTSGMCLAGSSPGVQLCIQCYRSIVCIHISLAVLASQLPWQLPHLASQRLVWSTGENVDLGCVGQNTESLF